MNVIVSGWRKANNDTHGPRWIGLRPGDAGPNWQGGNAGGEVQKLSAGKFHSVTQLDANDAAIAASSRNGNPRSRRLFDRHDHLDLYACVTRQSRHANSRAGVFSY